jgi:hypothetical protein
MTTSKRESKQEAEMQKVSPKHTRTALNVKTGLRVGLSDGYQPDYG